MMIVADVFSWHDPKAIVDVLATPLLLIATFFLAAYTAQLARETIKTRQAGMQPLCYMRVKMLAPYDGAGVGVTNVPDELRLAEDERQSDSFILAIRTQPAGHDSLMTIVRLELRVKNVGTGAALDLGIFPVAPGWTIRTMRKSGKKPKIFEPNNEQTIFFPEPLKGGEERKWTVELLYPYQGPQKLQLGKAEKQLAPALNISTLRIILAYEDVLGNRGSYEAGVARHKKPDPRYPSTADTLPKHDRTATMNARRERLSRPTINKEGT